MENLYLEGRNESYAEYSLARLLEHKGISSEESNELSRFLGESKTLLESRIGASYKIGGCCV